MMRHRRTLGTIALLALTFACAWAAWAGLIPGGGPQPSDCYLELDVQGVDTPGPQVTSNRVVECTDGDACDADATCGNDSCTLRVAVCIGQDDPNLAACTPPAAFRRLKVNKRLLPVLPGTMEGSACGGFIDLIVGVKVRRNGRKQAGMLALPANATAERGTNPARDRDKFVLKCLPSTACPTAAPTTTTTLPGTEMPTVTVGPGGAFRFAPSSVTIRVGDTVRWRWDSGGHNVVSGSDGNADGRFCSPDDQGCGSAPLSNTGTTYEHTFTEAGTFPYFCEPHVNFGMTGRVIVEP
jgi:plastocyanin